MAVERSWRIPNANEDDAKPEGAMWYEGWLVPDTRPQVIADAYQATLDEAPYLNTGGVPRLLRTEAPELAASLDNLAEEEL